MIDTKKFENKSEQDPIILKSTKKQTSLLLALNNQHDNDWHNKKDLQLLKISLVRKQKKNI